jgi:hypothetical protein
VPGQPVGPVDLDHSNGVRGQIPGQGRTEGSGALNSDRSHVAVTLDPAQQVGVAAVVRGELLVTQESAVVVDRGGVVGVLVGVDAADHGDCFWLDDHLGCHAGSAPP